MALWLGYWWMKVWIFALSLSVSIVCSLSLPVSPFPYLFIPSLVLESLKLQSFFASVDLSSENRTDFRLQLKREAFGEDEEETEKAEDEHAGSIAHCLASLFGLAVRVYWQPLEVTTIGRRRLSEVDKRSFVPRTTNSQRSDKWLMRTNQNNVGHNATIHCNVWH